MTEFYFSFLIFFFFAFCFFCFVIKSTPVQSVYLLWLFALGLVFVYSVFYPVLSEGSQSSTGHALMHVCVCCYQFPLSVQWRVRLRWSRWSPGLQLCAKGSLSALGAKWAAVHSQSYS